MIGIGAGPATDGQVLVFHDLLGIYDGHKPKFVKRYAELRRAMVDGLSSYAAEVRSGAFPGPGHVYSVEPAESWGTYGATSTRRASPAASSWDWEPRPRSWAAEAEPPPADSVRAG